MKTTILRLSVALVLTGGIWLRAQETQEGSAGTPSESKEGKTTIEQCKHMCAIQFSAESPGSLLAWKDELKLTDDQTASLKTVEEKAIADGKALLTSDQLSKLAELAKNMKPQSMMQLMQGMMHEKGMMHGMKEKMAEAMSMCCTATQEEAHH